MTDKETEYQHPEYQHPEYRNSGEPAQENGVDQDETVTQKPGAPEESGEVSDEPTLESHPEPTAESTLESTVEESENDSPEPADPEAEETQSEDASDEPDAPDTPPAATQENAPGEATPQGPTPETPASEEIKMVIVLKEGTGTVGIKKPDTDIFFESFQGLEIELLLEEVPGVIMNARAQWEDSPKYPAHERPRTLPTPRRQNGRQRATAANNGNTEPETPAEGAAPAAPEAPREIQQALL